MNHSKSVKYRKLGIEPLLLVALALGAIGPSQGLAQNAGRAGAEEPPRDDPAHVALLKAKWGPGRVVTDASGNVTDFLPPSDDFIGNPKLQQAASRLRHVRYFGANGGRKGVNLALATMASSRTLETTDLSGDVTDDTLANLENVQSLTRICILSEAVSDGAFRHLGKLKNLDSISISGGTPTSRPRINGSGLKELSGLTKLSELDLGNCLVGDSAMVSLTRLKIRELDLNSSAITDRGVEAIGRITSLERLAILNAAITDKAFQHFARLKDLWGLGLMHCYLLDGRGVKELASLKKLTCLCLTDCPVDDAALRSLKGLRLEALESAANQDNGPSSRRDIERSNAARAACWKYENHQCRTCPTQGNRWPARRQLTIRRTVKIPGEIEMNHAKSVKYRKLVIESLEQRKLRRSGSDFNR